MIDENEEREHCEEAAEDPCCDVEPCVIKTYAKRIERERAAARKPLVDAIRHFLFVYHEGGDDESVNAAVDKLTDLT